MLSILLKFVFALVLVSPRSTFLRKTRLHLSRTSQYFRSTEVSSSTTESEPQAIDESIVAQRNLILLEKLISPLTGNLSDIAAQYVNFCDESFNQFLDERMSSCESKSGKQALGKIKYELNVARQRKLVEADNILRGILRSGGVQEMEERLNQHLQKSEIDMAFIVILQLNIEDAARVQATKAVEVMTHLGQIITAHQDAQVTAPIRLTRQLVRTEDSQTRKQLLRRNLALCTDRMRGRGTLGAPAVTSLSEGGENVPVGGDSMVTAHELEDTIKDVLLQVRCAASSHPQLVYCRVL